MAETFRRSESTSIFYILASMLLVVLLPVMAHGAPDGSTPKKTGIMSGQVFVDGKVLADGLTSFFPVNEGLPPSGNGTIRVPKFMARSDSEGRFSVELLAGEYYMGMRRRDPAAGSGPPRHGEKYYFAAKPEGALRRLAIAEKAVIEVGRIDGAPPASFPVLSSAQGTPSSPKLETD